MTVCANYPPKNKKRARPHPENRDDIPRSGMTRRIFRLEGQKVSDDVRRRPVSSWKDSIAKAAKQWQRHKRPRHYQTMPQLEFPENHNPDRGAPPRSH